MKPDKNLIRLSGIEKESIVDGKGIRYVLFSQGCIHNCKGCHNPSTHDFGGGSEYGIDEIIDEIRKNPLLSGITCSGGEPFERAEEFSNIAKSVKTMGLDVWAYSGYTFEEIVENSSSRKGWSEFIENIDVLVDGKFQEEKKSLMLMFKGSSNQRIIDVQNSIKQNKVIEIEF